MFKHNNTRLLPSLAPLLIAYIDRSIDDDDDKTTVLNTRGHAAVISPWNVIIIPRRAVFGIFVVFFFLYILALFYAPIDEIE